MNAILDFIDSVWAKFKARRAAKAAADLQAGADILAQAQREADEMEAARKSLDAELSATPATPAPPAAPPVAAPPTPKP